MTLTLANLDVESITAAQALGSVFVHRASRVS